MYKISIKNIEINITKKFDIFKKNDKLLELVIIEVTNNLNES